MMNKPLPVLALTVASLVLLGRCHRGSLTGEGGPWGPPAAQPDRSGAANQDTAGTSPLAPGRFTEILVPDFKDEAPWPDFRAGEEIAAYLAREIAPRFKGTVSRWSGRGEEVAARDQVAVLSGSAALTRQLRKALRRLAVPADSPFRTAGRVFIEQAVYTLTLSVTVATAGDVLLEREFKETRVYEDIQKPPAFALYELLDRVSADLFPALFGRPPRWP